MTPEIKEMKKVRKSLTETVKKLPETSLVQAGLPFKEKGTTPEEKYECCHESKESAVLNSMEDTIFVKGFDPSLARDDIKTALRTHFGTCGKVTRVYVPTECKTGATIGYAFVDMRSSSVEKALKLSGSSLGGWNLEVMMAKDRSEFYNLTNFRGCERCFVIILNRVVARFNVTRGGRIIPTKFKVEP
ncbi:unnamed protein product [Arabis nemorensis]|uniref:RRM domain-containing protein n=1 Tax=Arabis nemorensis TaxID=586526 RepID=A0A565CHT5_9BRAS|nr:unnamed protein product [Arabis nemorensis]